MGLNAHARLKKAISEKTARVGVIGLGYVGLPLVRVFVAAGFQTLGFDVDAGKVERLLAGESYIAHISSEWIAACIARESFEPTADMRRLGEADALVICVPTPLGESRDPDLTHIEDHNPRRSPRPCDPASSWSWRAPRTRGPRGRWCCRSWPRGKLTVGEDFFLAFSPEREDPGNPDYTAERIPKVVGGIDAASRELAELLYRAAVTRVVPVSSCEVAEACKILENTYRSVNIAMVNELKVLFDRLGIDIWEVIEAAKTKPFGFQAFYPGPGLGGHCIPIDPFYLSWLARKHGMTTRFIELAGEINAGMPQYVMPAAERGP